MAQKYKFIMNESTYSVFFFRHHAVICRMFLSKRTDFFHHSFSNRIKEIDSIAPQSTNESKQNPQNNLTQHNDP